MCLRPVGIGAILQLHPDVVLLDVQLPDTDGFRLIAQLDAGEDVPACTAALP